MLEDMTKATMRGISQDALGGPEVLKEVEVELIDYRAADFAEVVRDVDVVLDMIGGAFPLADAARAHEIGDSGHVAGKLVLTVG